MSKLISFRFLIYKTMRRSCGWIRVWNLSKIC